MSDNPAERAARANIHPSTLNEMARVASYNVMEDLGAARFAHSPSGIIPEDRSKQQVPGNVRGNGTGWRTDVPFGHDGQHPTPGVAQADRIADAFAAKDRAELMAKAAPQPASQTERLLEVMTALANLLLARSEASGQDKKPAPKKK